MTVSASIEKKAVAPRELKLAFHGRVIDHLGIQMYQSPIAAVAELVANAWDADAERVNVELPGELDDGAVIAISDDGNGMTFQDCQSRFLEVGRNRRDEDGTSRTAKTRKVLGRKGIGKFAGFGIAGVIEIETVSAENGERTVFALDLKKLRGNSYYEKEPADVEVVSYDDPDDTRAAEHGTTVRLKDLKLKQRPSPAVQARGLSRRFLLQQQVEDFEVTVNGDPLPTDETTADIEFTFPADYIDAEKPEGLLVDPSNAYGEERLANGETIRWKFYFYKDTIDDKDLQGVAVFVNGKLAQTPFMFELSGGLHGQAGVPYLSGRVEADFIDEQADDLIATERQRINWENDKSKDLLLWGQQRIRDLLGLWAARRVADKIRIVDEKIAPFSARLDNFTKNEQKTVETALKKIAEIKSLSVEQFELLAEAVLIAWENGRLKGLIESVAQARDLPDDELLAILVEATTLTTLATGEAVRTNLLVVEGLQQRIQKQELENPIRDYIAEHPWLLGPEWSTFEIETSPTKILKEARKKAGLDDPATWPGRVDLALSAGPVLLVVEFMRPGETVDLDHINRWENYIWIVRSEITASNALGFTEVRGLLVADKLAKKPELTSKIKSLGEHEQMKAAEWSAVLGMAASRWKEYFKLLVGRSDEDRRLRQLADELEIPVSPHLGTPAKPAQPANSKETAGKEAKSKAPPKAAVAASKVRKKSSGSKKPG